MKKDPRQIEELLQQSTRAQQSLSTAEKDALWTRIQNMNEHQQAVGATAQVMEAEELNTGERWWGQPLKLQWSLSLGMAAVMLAIASVYSTLDVTQTAQEQAELAALQTVDYSQRVIVEEPVADENPEEDENEEDIEDTQLAAEETTTLFSSDLRELVGGFGGGLNLETNLWKLQVLTELSTETPGSFKELHLYRLTEERMHALASVFPVVEDTRLHNSYEPYHRISFVTNLGEGVAEGGGCFDNALRDTMGTQACVAISELGSVEFIREQAIAGTTGFEDAYAYIEALSGYTKEDLTLVDLGIADDFAEIATFFEGLHEYILYPKYSELEGIPYQDLGWHIALTEEGGLVFLQGAVPEIHVSPESETYSIVSAAEAIERVRVDWSSPILLDDSDITPTPNYVIAHRFNRNGWPTPSYTNAEGEYATIPDNEVDIAIESVRLEYRIVMNSDYEDGKRKASAQAVPIWIIRGTEQSQNLPFEAFVEPTGTLLFNHQDSIGNPVYHPSALE